MKGNSTKADIITKIVEDLLPAYRQHAASLAQELQNVIDSLSDDRIISTELLQKSLEDLSVQEQMQDELCNKIEQVLPSCTDKNLDVIQNLLTEMRKQHDQCSNAKKALQAFQSVRVDNESAQEVLIECKNKALQFAAETDVSKLLEMSVPYCLFLGIVETPSIDISPEEECQIENEFPKPLPRLLYGGQFYIEKTTEQGLPPSRFIFETKKEDSQFSATSFLRQIGRKVGKDEWEFLLPYGTQLGKFILKLGWHGILTKEHISSFILDQESEAVAEAVVYQLEKDGYITKIIDTCSDTISYCLSAKGINIFTTNKTAEMLKYGGGSLPNSEMLLSSQKLEAHPEIIPGLITINGIVLYLIYDGLKLFFQKRDEKLLLKLANCETPNQKIPYARLFIRDYSSGVDCTLTIFSLSQISDEIIAEVESISSENDVLLLAIDKMATDKLLFSSPSQIYIANYIVDQHKLQLTNMNQDDISLSTFLEDLFGKADDGTNHEKIECEESVEDNLYEEETEVKLETNNSTQKEEDPTTKNLHDQETTQETDDDKLIQPTNVSASKKSARDKAADLLKQDVTPDDIEKFIDLFNTLLTEGKEIVEKDIFENSLAQAIVLMKSLSFVDEPSYAKLYQQLVLATDTPLEEHEYSSDSLLTLFDDSSQGTAYYLAALLRALFAPRIPYDYTLKAHADKVFRNYDINFAQYLAIKPLFNLLTKIYDLSPEGFSNAVLQQFSSQQAKNEFLREIQDTADRFYEEPTIKIRITGIPKMNSLCFGPGSDLRQCMEIIRKNQLDQRDLVLLAYHEFCDKDSNGELVISEDKLLRVFEKNWKKACESERTKNMPLKFAPRDKILDEFHQRLELMQKWLSLTELGTLSEDKSKQLLSLRKEIIAEINTVLPVMQKSYSPCDNTILSAILKRMKAKLSGQLAEDYSIFAEFLRSGVYSVDDRGLPIIDKGFQSIKYYEPWRIALRHIATPVIGFEKVLEYISDKQQPRYFDNLGLAMATSKFLNKRYDSKSFSVDQFAKDIPSAGKSAITRTEDFKSELELAFAYGQISESLKEDILEDIIHHKEKFFATNDFGRWNQFIEAMRRMVLDASNHRRTELEQDIETRLAANPKSKSKKLLDIAKNKLESAVKDFVAAEEYINRFDAGIDDVILSDSNDDNAFLQFIDKSYFNSIYNLCKKNQSQSLKGFGWNFVETRLRKQGFSAQYRESSKTFIQSLPNRPEEATENRIITLLTEIGLNVKKARKVPSGPGLTRFSVEVVPNQKNKAEYAHPVDIMGTRIHSPINVIFLYGKLQANDIVNKICGLELSHTSLVLMNGALGLAARCQIAERFHQEKSGQNPFLLIDWVLLLHLALFEKTERLPIMLNCTLPYTSSFQPFVASGAVSDEMFIGRKKELNQILDRNGPVILYGGRQLGKTALLERACSRAHSPEKKEFAIYANAVLCNNETKLVKLLAGKLGEAGLPVGKVDTMQSLCRVLKNMYGKNWSRLLLLVDETDKILANFKESQPAYAPINPLSNLKRETQNDFKFILAGLHNVCRAANDPNTVFGQLGGALCIKPLASPDALQLLARPLRYLGFRVDNGNLEHILINTSFYPGIIHHVGYKIVENLSIKYADYYCAVDGNPPYDLTDDQLGSIMNSADLNNGINERIRWTLEVDPRYFMLARCIALLYYHYPESNKDGYPIDQILEYAQILDITGLKDLDQQDCSTLLLEMVEMGILVKPTEDSFRLRQRRFLEAIGTSPEKIELEIDIAEGRTGQ